MIGWGDGFALGEQQICSVSGRWRWATDLSLAGTKQSIGCNRRRRGGPFVGALRHRTLGGRTRRFLTAAPRRSNRQHRPVAAHRDVQSLLAGVSGPGLEGAQGQLWRKQGVRRVSHQCEAIESRSPTPVPPSSRCL